MLSFIENSNWIVYSPSTDNESAISTYVYPLLVVNDSYNYVYFLIRIILVLGFSTTILNCLLAPFLYIITCW